MKRPSPAFVIAMIALFVALGGTAGAVVTAAVPLAKRALVADNAKKLNGVTAGQLGGAAVQLALKQSPAGPRPASTAAEPHLVKTVPFAPTRRGRAGVHRNAVTRAARRSRGGFSNPTAALGSAPDRSHTTDRASDGSELIGQPREARRPAAAGLVVVICLK